MGLNVLRESTAKSKVAVLLTDGENNSGEIGPLDAAQLGRLLGVKVYTIGAIRADVSRVDVDEQLMRRISELTGARYFRAADEGTLLGVYREIEALEKTKVGSRDEAEHDERNVAFPAAGAALLLLEVLLAATLFRRVP
jgi:Ca-activated chloride channel family protein